MINKPWTKTMPPEDHDNTLYRSVTTVPPPIRRLFNNFPLVTYQANDLPLRAPSDRQQHVLYVFTTSDGALRGDPSFNPGCLKWQAYLKFRGIDFITVASSNHASPSGALPFLLPSGASASLLDQPKPVPTSKLQKWATEHSSSALEEPSDLRYEAYLSLLDHRIRRAWLYTLYLTPNNITIAEPMYIHPTSSNPIVRAAIMQELCRAAEAELLKYGPVIDAETLYREAEEAFDALETTLGDGEWFFGAKQPGLVDASVFAYTHLLLDNPAAGWKDSRLRDAVKMKSGLVRHRERILQSFFA
ncbi:putative mitochondrial outer membrane protein [Saccharata proteae CBS 121410]|uniref:Mitochondrial outer membrane protein n=1 Tax=Saccharata proteae CBS 121410 TaxID=1314787 RepID=A0A9P4HYE4_9PEZI|nr:putative mitochondrial outer membrane protein [Saccharata proteae CBS 121410]